jgi:hypothetical protein
MPQPVAQSMSQCRPGHRGLCLPSRPPVGEKTQAGTLSPRGADAAVSGMTLPPWLRGLPAGHHRRAFFGARDVCDYRAGNLP